MNPRVLRFLAPLLASETYSMRDSRFLDESLTKSAIFTSFFSGGPTPAATGGGPGPGPPGPLPGTGPACLF